MAKERRLRDGEFAFEPQDKTNHKFVKCDRCGRDVLKKKAKRRHGEWICPNCKK